MGYNLTNRYNFDCKRIQNDDSYHIEYCITDICDRNCAACSHLAPLAVYPNFVGCDKFERDIKILNKILPDIHTFWLTGGEPALHPQFLNLLDISRRTFQTCYVGIYSNGNCLKKYQNDENFWEFIRENGIVWAITNYDCGKEYFENLFGMHGCLNNLTYVHSGKHFFNLTNYSRNQPVSVEKYEKCGWERSKLNIRNGKIFNCPSAEFVDLFNNYFDKDIKLCASDYLEIDEQLTKSRVDNFKGPVPFCENCDLTQRYKKFFKNYKSKKEISEWSTFD